MPLFMDVHSKLPEGAQAKDVADAHAADLEIQDQYKVHTSTIGSTRKRARSSAWSMPRTRRRPTPFTEKHTDSSPMRYTPSSKASCLVRIELPVAPIVTSSSAKLGIPRSRRGIRHAEPRDRHAVRGE
jgi:hypothetical protein